MPITKTMAYKVGEEMYPNLEQAQLAEMTAALDKTPIEAIPSYIVNNKEAFIRILTASPENEKKPRKPRSDKGKKRAKEAAINRALQDGKQ